MRFMEAIKVKVWLREQGYERVRIRDLATDGMEGYAVDAQRPNGPLVSIQEYYPAVYGPPAESVDDACRFCHGHGCVYCGGDTGEWRGF